MQLRVVVTTRGSTPAPGTPLHVEVRDTSVADTDAVVVAAADAPVTGPAEGGGIASLTLELPDHGAPGDWTVWAHVRAAGEPRVSSGDWITVQSYPASSAPARSTAAPAPTVAVEVVQI